MKNCTHLTGLTSSIAKYYIVSDQSESMVVEGAGGGGGGGRGEGGGEGGRG